MQCERRNRVVGTVARGDGASLYPNTGNIFISERVSGSESTRNRIMRLAPRSYRCSHIRYTSRVRCFRTSELHSSVQLGKPSNVGFAPLAEVPLASISSARRARWGRRLSIFCCELYGAWDVARRQSRSVEIKCKIPKTYQRVFQWRRQRPPPLWPQARQPQLPRTRAWGPQPPGPSAGH